MEEAIIAFLLEAVPVRIAELHLSPRINFLIAVAIPVGLAMLGGLVGRRRSRPRVWKASVNDDGNVEWVEEALTIPAALPHAAGPSTARATGPDTAKSTEGDRNEPSSDKNCKRCGSQSIELVAGLCGDCHLAARDAGYQLIAGRWIRYPVQDRPQGVHSAGR